MHIFLLGRMTVCMPFLLKKVCYYFGISLKFHMRYNDHDQYKHCKSEGPLIISK